MKSLEKKLGLPVEEEEDYRLVFGNDVVMDSISVRDFSSLRTFLKDPFSSSTRRDVYSEYRNLAVDLDREKIESANLQYDVVVVPPGLYGEEFAKTIGHYNNAPQGSEKSFPEIVEVAAGRAFIILQLATDGFEVLREVYLGDLTSGNKVLIPPGFGYVVVNPTNEALVFSRWSSRDRCSLNQPYESKSGAAYYVVTSQRLSASGETNLEYDFLPNLAYKSLPKLTPIKPLDLPQFDLLRALPMYFTAQRNLESMLFLNFPDRFVEELEVERVYSVQRSVVLNS